MASLESKPKPTRMSFSIEELAKSSRNDNVYPVYVYADEYNTVSTTQVLEKTSLRKRNRSYDSINSDDSINSSDSKYIVCTSPSSTSDDSDNSDQPMNRPRTTFTNSQLEKLEIYYSYSKYVAVDERQLLAKRLKLSQQQIKWWFQNRRMKEKRQQKELYGAVDTTQFVSIGKPGPQQQLQQQQEFANYPHQPMYTQMSPYYCGYSHMSPVMYPGCTVLHNSSTDSGSVI